MSVYDSLSHKILSSDYDDYQPVFMNDDEVIFSSEFRGDAIVSDDIWKKFELLPTPPRSPVHNAFQSLKSKEIKTISKPDNFKWQDQFLTHGKIICGSDDQSDIVKKDCMWSGIGHTPKSGTKRNFPSTKKVITLKPVSVQLNNREYSIMKKSPKETESNSGSIFKTCSLLNGTKLIKATALSSQIIQTSSKKSGGHNLFTLVSKVSPSKPTIKSNINSHSICQRFTSGSKRIQAVGNCNQSIHGKKTITLQLKTPISKQTSISLLPSVSHNSSVLASSLINNQTSTEVFQMGCLNESTLSKIQKSANTTYTCGRYQKKPTKTSTCAVKRSNTKDSSVDTLVQPAKKRRAKMIRVVDSDSGKKRPKVLDQQGVWRDDKPSNLIKSLGDSGDEENLKSVHNVLERNRRDHLRNSFTALRLLIPDLINNDKASKVAVLRGSRAHIELLQQEQESLKMKKNLLEAKRDNLNKVFRKLNSSR